LGERLVRNEEVRGSIPLGSTILSSTDGSTATRRLAPAPEQQPRRAPSAGHANGR